MQNCEPLLLAEIRSQTNRTGVTPGANNIWSWAFVSVTQAHIIRYPKTGLVNYNNVCFLTSLVEGIGEILTTFRDNSDRWGKHCDPLSSALYPFSKNVRYPADSATLPGALQAFMSGAHAEYVLTTERRSKTSDDTEARACVAQQKLLLDGTSKASQFCVALLQTNDRDNKTTFSLARDGAMSLTPGHHPFWKMAHNTIESSVANDWDERYDNKEKQSRIDALQVMLDLSEADSTAKTIQGMRMQALQEDYEQSQVTESDQSIL